MHPSLFSPLVVLRALYLALCLAVGVLPGLARAGVYDDFFRAVAVDDAATVRTLLARGFDPNTTGPTGLPALHHALMERSFKVAQVLVETPSTHSDRRNALGETPLMLAALRGHRPLVQALLSRGADLNPVGWTPLHYAVTGDDEASPDVIRLLLKNGARPDLVSPTGTTPLMLATLYGSEEAIALLLQAKANPLLQNHAGRTALELAVGIQREGAQILLRDGMARWQLERAAQEAGAQALDALSPITSVAPTAKPSSTPGSPPAAAQ